MSDMKVLPPSQERDLFYYPGIRVTHREDVLRLASIDFAITLAQVYEDVAV